MNRPLFAASLAAAGLAGFALSGWSHPASAQSGPAPTPASPAASAPAASKIVVVDSERVINESAVGKRCLAELKDLIDAKVPDQELRAKREGLLLKIEQQATQAIKHLAAQEHYTLVFQKRQAGLMHVDFASDITNEVIQRMDRTAQ